MQGDAEIEARSSGWTVTLALAFVVLGLSLAKEKYVSEDSSRNRTEGDGPVMRTEK